MLKLIHISEGLRLFSNSTKRKLYSSKQYSGNASQICQQIIKDCWNNNYFMNSTGNYRSFWARDFGFTVDSLIKLGFKAKVLKTLGYALNIFSKNNKITTTINPKGIAFDFPNAYSPDSVALFFYSLKQANAKKLIKQHKKFLNKEINRFYNEVLDKKTGLVKKNIFFSGARDHVLRNSSCYDNIMLALMAKIVKNLKLSNPFKKYDFKNKIKQNFWTGTHFKDDLSSNHITGDANIIPFWTGIFTDKNMMKSVFETLSRQGLTTPFPLKYQTKGKKKMLWFERFVSGWEYDCIWTQWGLMYLNLLKQIDKNQAKIMKNKYQRIIEKYNGGHEVFSPKGKPYKNLFYMSDKEMLWFANFLTV